MYFKMIILGLNCVYIFTGAGTVGLKIRIGDDEMFRKLLDFSVQVFGSQTGRQAKSMNSIKETKLKVICRFTAVRVRCCLYIHAGD